MRIYVVGDSHGRSDLVDLVLAEILSDASQAARRGMRPVIVFLGDYVDRGADSRGVLNRLCRLPKGLVRWHFLEGNHEAAMLAFMVAPEKNAAWLAFGGAETLASYGIALPSGPLQPGDLESLVVALDNRLPMAHRHFLYELDLSLELGDYLFVHAGIRPGVPLAAQSRRDLLSIRKPFLSWRTCHAKRVVHGHTIVDEPEILPERIGIDTGAYFSGRLTCLVLEEDSISLFTTRPDGGGVTWRSG